MRFQDLLVFSVGAAAAAADPAANATKPKECPSTHGHKPVATISSGVVRGAATMFPDAPLAVNKFLGIPYAAPPERFALPKPPAPWTMPFKATSFGPSCYQSFVNNSVAPRPAVVEGLYNNPPAPESEDCLTINVFAPANKTKAASRAVIVFIVGGAFHNGNGRSDLSAFAAYEDIIAVDFNYRTNIFGFPGSSQIPLGERNVGLYDQRLALRWVQENIAAFGGDPSKVTVWGHSAGATSVDYHLRAYGADGAPPAPFRAAVMLSGQSTYGLAAATYPVNGTQWPSIASAVGCGNQTNVLECMKRVPAKDLIGAQLSTGVTTGPMRDNVTVLPRPIDAWQAGKVAKVPLLMATVAQEGRALVNDKITLDLFFESYLPSTLVPQAGRDAIIASYRADPNLKTDYDISAAIYTDYVFQCPAAKLADTATKIDIPTWRYYFNQSIISQVPEDLNFLGVFHGSDLKLLLSNPTTTKYTKEQLEVYVYLRAAFAKFVKNPVEGPGWAGVEKDPLDVVVLGSFGGTPAVSTPYNTTILDGRCALYEPLYPVLGTFLP